MKGRGAAPATPPAPAPGIMGRGGKSMGRAPCVGDADGAAGFATDGTVLGGAADGILLVCAAAGGAEVTSGFSLIDWAARRGASVITGAELAAGAGLRGALGGGESVSIKAVASPAFARDAPIFSDAVARLPLGATKEFDENSSSIELVAATVITPPQTEQRARTVVGGTLAGSTRKTERHSGQVTFTCPPRH